MLHRDRGLPVASDAHRRAVAWGIGWVLGVGAIGRAHAGDGVRPRTPVLWPADTPCLLEVDRTASATVNLAYDLAFEDPMAGMAITEDEVPDGRRHQFFAFSADIDPRVAMPEWITWADVTQAAALGLVEPATVEDAWVLETHPALGMMFARINADDARRPITLAQAGMGVDWDTSAVAPGTYVVRAYTWDPWPNLWADARPGAVRVYDDPADGLLVPALAVSTAAAVLHRDEVGMIDGCLAAPDGTTLSAAWADFTDPDGAFTEFVGGIEAPGGVVAIPFAPPEPLWGKFAVVRVSAVDPGGRRYDAFVPQSITILATDAPSGCEGDCGSSSSSGGPADSGEGDGDGTAAVPGGSDGTTGTSGTSGGSEGSDATGQDDAARSCACSGGRTRDRAAALLLLWLGVRRRARA